MAGSAVPATIAICCVWASVHFGSLCYNE